MSENVIGSELVFYSYDPLIPSLILFSSLWSVF